MPQEELRKVLRAYPDSMTELAGRVGISRVSLQRFKSGTKNLALDTLQRLAEELGWEIVARPKQRARKSEK